MPKTKSSKRWLQEHFDDPYVKKAQEEGYRSRAIFKLMEIDEKANLLRPGMTVIDLGAAPGGWTQYISRKLAGKGKIIALDILPMDALADVQMITGDFHEEKVYQQLLAAAPQKGVDLILSDMAPNMSGSREVDIPRAMALAELALELCSKLLRPDGNLLMKIFHGEGFDALLRQSKSHFSSVSIRKPKASRARSREAYLLAKGYKIV